LGLVMMLEEERRLKDAGKRTVERRREKDK
jgi:hypothetical protein